MALKKKQTATQEKPTTETLKEEPKFDLQKAYEPPVKPPTEKKKFGFIKKDEGAVLSVEKPETSMEKEEEVKAAKIWTDPKESAEEETKMSHEEGEYNPDLIKNQLFFRREEGNNENLSNEFGNSSEKNFSHQEDNEKSAKSEKIIMDEVTEKPKENEHKRGFKFSSKGKSGDKKEKEAKSKNNENENSDYQTKSSKDLDELKDQDFKKDILNDNVSISHSEKITYTQPMKDNMKSLDEKGGNEKSRKNIFLIKLKTFFIK